MNSAYLSYCVHTVVLTDLRRFVFNLYEEAAPERASRRLRRPRRSRSGDDDDLSAVPRLAPRRAGDAPRTPGCDAMASVSPSIVLAALMLLYSATHVGANNRSVALANDSSDREEPQYFSHRYRIIGTFFQTIVLVVGVAGNVMVVVVVCRTHSMLSPTNCYLVSTPFPPRRRRTNLTVLISERLQNIFTPETRLLTNTLSHSVVIIG